MARKSGRKCFGIIGGLGAIAGADIFFKLVKSTPAYSDKEHFDIVIEQHPFDENDVAGGENANPNARKLYIFDMIKQFEQRKVDAVLMPCFISHTFIDELKAEIRLPLVNIMEALWSHVERRYPEARRLGVLTSNYVRKKGLFEKYFDKQGYELIYPSPEVQEHYLMQAIYSPHGIKAGNLQGESIELLYKACRNLMDQNAELIVPGFTEISIVVEALRQRGAPIIDANQVYVQHAISCGGETLAKTFKVGIIGGVGPAATVDFMNKIIRNTQARRDQEHIKMIVEHNPKIPDRTENLIAEGPDPTVALYSACKKLEANDADMIAIPCNTAHAFVERIQPYLSIPIVNMLFETVDHIKKHHPECTTIGLLATSGTITSRVYHDVVERTDFQIIVPDEEHQKRVMNAIYGEKGVKAGYAEGEAKEDLSLALEHLARRGAEVIVLGCTELPLLLSQAEAFPAAGRNVVVLDPTEILARKCVSFSRCNEL
ncbi:MAG: aspartate/glutamate racemase family protein [Syntrophobacteraceae bacterium]|nr:aspartate/glutamate racemase family protein [Syntrophobacteraceae bacterium]